MFAAQDTVVPLNKFQIRSIKIAFFPLTLILLLLSYFFFYSLVQNTFKNIIKASKSHLCDKCLFIRVAIMVTFCNSFQLNLVDQLVACYQTVRRRFVEKSYII